MWCEVLPSQQVSDVLRSHSVYRCSEITLQQAPRTMRDMNTTTNNIQSVCTIALFRQVLLLSQSCLVITLLNTFRRVWLNYRASQPLSVARNWSIYSLLLKFLSNIRPWFHGHKKCTKLTGSIQNRTIRWQLQYILILMNELMCISHELWAHDNTDVYNMHCKPITRCTPWDMEFRTLRDFLGSLKENVQQTFSGAESSHLVRFLDTK